MAQWLGLQGSCSSLKVKCDWLATQTENKILKDRNDDIKTTEAATRTIPNWRFSHFVPATTSMDHTNVQMYKWIRSDEGLTLETSAFRISVRWPIYIINSVDNTKFLHTNVQSRISSLCSSANITLYCYLCLKRVGAKPPIMANLRRAATGCRLKSRFQEATELLIRASEFSYSMVLLLPPQSLISESYRVVTFYTGPHQLQHLNTTIPK